MGAQGTPGTNGTNGTNGTDGTDTTVVSGAASDQVDTATSGVEAITVGPDTVTSQCIVRGGEGGAILAITHTGDQYLHGTIDVSGTNANNTLEFVPSNESASRTPYDDGLDMVGLEDSVAAGSGSDEFVAGASDSSVDLSYQLHELIDDATHAYTVDVAGFASQTRCQIFTTVTPTNGDTASVNP
jgi:hypothetical protein